MNLTGQTLLERYGMTEIGMALTNSYRDVATRTKGRVGLPFPNVQCRLIDDEERLIETLDTPGELRIKGSF